MERREVARLVFGSAAGALLVTEHSQAQTCAAAPCYPQTFAEQQLHITPVNSAYPPGSLVRYGADPTGNTDPAVVTQTTAAINNAFACNAVVFDDYQGVVTQGGIKYATGGTYVTNGVVQFQSAGQILRGQGMGDNNPSGNNFAPRTIIRYIGPAGPVLSVASSTNWSEVTVRDLLIDGGGSANVGIEGYNDNIAGGCWRNRFERVAVINLTSTASSTAIKLGTKSFPNFAHDAQIEGCYFFGSTYGVRGAGAKHGISRTTFKSISGAACNAISGSAWSFSQCIFSANGWDFSGSSIQQADFSGCWFENSTLGIYQASGAHSVSFTGCVFHTSAATMMDFGDSAGYHYIGGHFISATTASLNIINVNPGATGAVIGQAIPMIFATTGQNVPLILPPAQTGTGTVRSASAQMTSGQHLVLTLGRGAFFVAVDVWRATSANVRTQATYSAFLFDGDNEGVTVIASRSGSGGGQAFSLQPSTNSVTLTYLGGDLVQAFISGTGVVG